ncbi:MAG: hypothetical protein ACTS5F_01455 [Candidatus Hodgkinia cicadicola]
MGYNKLNWITNIALNRLNAGTKRRTTLYVWICYLICAISNV